VATITWLSRVAATFGIVAGLLVLAAWKFAVVAIITAGSHRSGMARSTALGLIFCGASLLSQQEPSYSKWIKRFGNISALISILIGMAPFLRLAGALPLSLDENSFFGPLPTASTLLTVRMAPNTALCLILLGLSLLLINVQIGRSRPYQWGALLAGTIALAACIGHAYDVRALYGIAGYTDMAVHTAVTLLILSVGLLFARPEVGLMVILSREGPVGTLARRFLPVVIAAPIVTGWLRLKGQHSGWFGTETGTVLYATLNVIFLLLFLYLAMTSRTAAEDKFRGLLESAPDAMVIANRMGHIVLVNAQTERLFGYSREELLGNPVEMLMPARFHGKHIGDRTRYSASPQIRPMGTGPTLYGRRKDGIEFPVEIMLAPMQSDQGVLISSAIRDVSERKRIEDALRESEERFRVALKNAPTVVFNQDRELRYTWINSPVLFWAEQDYLGCTDAEILGGEEGARLSAIKQQVLQTGVGSRTETIVTFQGEPHYFDLTVEPLRDGYGEVVGITCATTDITPIKQGAAERELLIRELQEAVAHVKILTGLLPICASCKKIRDKRGEWGPIEEYIQEHSHASFSHGICPECAHRLYPEIYTK